MTQEEEIAEASNRALEANKSRQEDEAREFLEGIIKEQLEPLITKVDELAYDRLPFVPIAPLTPASDLEDVKRTLNYLVTYLNEGIDNG